MGRHLYDIYSVHLCLCSFGLIAHPQSPGYQIPFNLFEKVLVFNIKFTNYGGLIFTTPHNIRSHASTEDEVKRTNYQRFPDTRCPAKYIQPFTEFYRDLINQYKIGYV